MTLITRMSRLFRADLHAVLDHIEEPQALLRQAIREMEEELNNDARLALALKRQHEALAAHEAELQAALRALEEELDLCFSSGEEALARGLIKRKLVTERAIKAKGLQRKEVETELADVQARLAENRSRLDTIRQKAEAMADIPAHYASDWVRPDIADGEIDIAFLREKQKRGQP
jgi:phage shock protein A